MCCAHALQCDAQVQRRDASITRAPAPHIAALLIVVTDRLRRGGHRRGSVCHQDMCGRSRGQRQRVHCHGGAHPGVLARCRRLLSASRSVALYHGVVIWLHRRRHRRVCCPPAGRREGQPKGTSTAASRRRRRHGRGLGKHYVVVRRRRRQEVAHPLALGGTAILLVASCGVGTTTSAYRPPTALPRAASCVRAVRQDSQGQVEARRRCGHLRAEPRESAKAGAVSCLNCAPSPLCCSVCHRAHTGTLVATARTSVGGGTPASVASWRGGDTWLARAPSGLWAPCSARCLRRTAWRARCTACATEVMP